jgi:tellurite resistance protein/GTP-binding protein EngB required for normal cell division
MIDKEITMSSAEKARLLANLKRVSAEVEKSSQNTSESLPTSTGSGQKNISDAFHQRHQLEKVDTKNGIESVEKNSLKIEVSNISQSQPAEFDYPFLLAVYVACADGQIHKHEVDALTQKAEELQINQETLEQMAKIFAQESDAITQDAVLQGVGRERCQEAIRLGVFVAAIDGSIEPAELAVIERLRAFWNVEKQKVEAIQAQALIDAEAQRRAKKTQEQSVTISGKTKFLKGLDTVLSRKVVDVIVDTLGKDSTRKFIDEARTQILLQGPEYDAAIEQCKKIGLEDIGVVDKCLLTTQQALLTLEKDLDHVIASFTRDYSQSSSASEVVNYLKGDKEVINTRLKVNINALMTTQEKKRKAINYFTISFMGKSKAGKSTLHAIVTGEGWDAIGVGKQNTTKFNRVYEWHNIRIIDTPGIAAPVGSDYQRIAESIVDESDLMCFVVTNNNQQKSEFEFLKMLKNKGKPLLVLLNVQENLTQAVRLQRFLDNPDAIFSEDKAKLGGHFDRIRRDASEYYGTQDFPIVPVQLLAARLSREENNSQKALSLMKASRLQHYLDEVRVSLIKEGAIRRSQNLLGSTVVDIEQPLIWLNEQVTHYQSVRKTMQERGISAQASIKKAAEQGQNRLHPAIKKAFEGARKEIHLFAEEHWDADQENINDEWTARLQRINFENNIKNAIEKISVDFSNDVQGILEEIGKELQLISQLEQSAFQLNAQDSSGFGHQATKWGGSILGVAGSVLVLMSNPLGWVIGIGGAILGFLSSFFESRDSKKRKAVAKISSALEEQTGKQEQFIFNKVMTSFEQQSQAIAIAVNDYFEQIDLGTSQMSQTLQKAAFQLKEQVTILNMGFAMRVIDCAEGKINVLDLEKAKKLIANVTRQVGHSMEIEFVGKVPHKLQFSAVEKTIQEKISTTSKVV